MQGLTKIFQTGAGFCQYFTWKYAKIKARKRFQNFQKILNRLAREMVGKNLKSRRTSQWSHVENMLMRKFGQRALIFLL
ncbi:hypothetical protein HMPREF1557_01180 [Streptococcus sobrinus W1703]|uniref:Uncharacterized protein n=1 Tax=Streptococcus sobrinus W1703 TaxID=1227275 RepID=U2KMZ3_9STRE|nr:hypothetical protein HMPREF1557_01180 [Streptococcus sobrinus W1703]